MAKFKRANAIESHKSLGRKRNHFNVFASIMVKLKAKITK